MNGQPPTDKRVDGVVLLHGIARTAKSMARMERALLGEGFAVLNPTYNSRRKPLEVLVEEIHGRVSAFAEGVGSLHFVTHSMGGLLARAYVCKYRPERLGRVVMLGPPNAGSEIADLLVDSLFYRKLFGPAGAQLTTQQDATLCALLGTIDYPLGVIAGDRSLDPLAFLLLPGANDGRVAVARTRVEGVADHVTLHVTHTLMMRSTRVIRQTIGFLREGRFAQRAAA